MGFVLVSCNLFLASSFKSVSVTELEEEFLILFAVSCFCLKRELHEPGLGGGAEPKVLSLA